MSNNASHTLSHWSIRGVPAEVKQLAADAAARAGVTIAEWVTDAVRLAASSSTPAATAPTLLDLARRVEMLEQQRANAVMALRGEKPKPQQPRQAGIGGLREPTPTAVINRIGELARQGLGRRQIARTLAAEGIDVSESTAEKYRHAAVAGQ
jgi:hypothetical protein